MIGFYNYTVILTYVSLVISMCGIGCAMTHHPLAAIFCLMGSGFCDMFDGKIARTKKDRTEEECRYGIQIDSLCDLVCFGVLPAVIGIMVSGLKWYMMAIACIFILAGMIRLAYYNVTEETRQQETSEVRHKYVGLPITSSALIMPVVYCFRELIGVHFHMVYAAMLLIVGLLFVLPIEIKKPKSKAMVVMLIAGLLIAAVLILTKYVL